MAGAINYCTEYAQMLDQAYPYALHYGRLYATPNNGRYKWVNGKTIEIPHISVTGRVDSNRDATGFISRHHENDWEAKTLSRQRSWETLVHEKDIDQTNAVLTLNNIVSVYNNEQKFPEMDAYCISKLYADWKGLSQTAITTALSVDNILDTIDDMFVDQSEHRVTPTGRILYVTPTVAKLIRNARAIDRQISISNFGGRVTRDVNAIDNVIVEEVPSELMQTAYDFSEGWKKGVSAKQINMLLVDPNAVITPVSYSAARLDPPSAGSKNKWVYLEESYEDVFILNQKVHGLKFHCETGA